MIFFFFGLNLLTQGMKECILHYILYDTFFSNFLFFMLGSKIHLRFVLFFVFFVFFFI